MLLYHPEVKEIIRPLLYRLQKACYNEGCTIEQAVTSYTCNRTSAVALILGVRTREQAEKDFAPLRGELSDSLVDVMQKISEEAASFFPEAPNMFNHKS